MASVGIVFAKTLPFTTTNTTIKTFRHALALDEVLLYSVSLTMHNNNVSVLPQRRTKFQPSLYHRLSPNATRTVKDLEMAAEIARASGEEPTSPVSMSTDSSEGNVKGKDKATAQPEVKVGTPPGKISPRGKGNKWRPFPQRGQRSKRGQGVNPRDMSAVTDPSDDYVGVTDMLEVWFCGGHGGE